ncbi:restriction endonuclease subunit S [Thomasclavelia cocleata]|uniref:restriction endonuclease subunit S n=1 Tax=Thomasclavelia cocleata TaxID=69824 RepID=UPI00272DEA2D|nr:restriction endonuclease subunit S [Thomasclavelia cocleata]
MVVPKLRFKEFKNEWKQINLSNTFTFYSTNSLSRADLVESGSIKNIHYGDIHQRFHNLLDIDVESLPYIKSNSKINIDNCKTYCQDGDLIFADASEDYDGIGKAVEIMNIGNNKVVSGLHTIWARDINNIMSNGFKGYLFNTPIIHNQIRILANGFKVYGISKNNICDLDVKVPSKSEQEKIAHFLSLLDKKIKLQQKKFEALKIYKIGLLYKTFSKHSTNYKIKDLLTFGKSGGTPKSTNISYYNGNIPFLSITDMTSQGKYINYTEKHISDIGLKNSSAWLLPVNTLILSMYASYGLVSINKIELSTSQAMFNMIFKENINIEYIYYYLNYLKETHFYDELVSTGTQSNLNADKVKNISIYLPNQTEQYRISNLFNLLDKKMELHQNILNSLIILKKSLLQQMFI